MYGAFFFVIKGKSIKLLTKDGQDGVHESPEIVLQQNLSCLDWTYMLDHKAGELVVNIGATFTPELDKPVTGLWRLDALEDSYGEAGFNWETIHHQCMLSRYGALQAEMNEECVLQTHFAFWSTYNLYYEAVYTSNNVPIFAKESNAYHLTPKYYAKCSKMVKVFGAAKSKIYGVQDEYRVSGQAAQVLLKEIVPRVCISLALSILWLIVQPQGQEICIHM